MTKEEIRSLIQIHIAALYREVFRPFHGKLLNPLTAYDIAQAARIFEAELVDMALNLGREESHVPLSDEHRESIRKAMKLSDLWAEIRKVEAESK